MNDLFETQAYQLARNTDPSTSHEAAEKLAAEKAAAEKVAAEMAEQVARVGVTEARCVQSCVPARGARRRRRPVSGLRGGCRWPTQRTGGGFLPSKIENPRPPATKGNSATWPAFAAPSAPQNGAPRKFHARRHK